MFYELSDGRMVFLGLRYSDTLKLAESPKQFLQKFLATTAQAQHKSLAQTISLLGEVLDGNKNAYTQHPIDYVELGVEGFWKSEGSLVLRRRSDRKLSKEALAAQLSAHPHLAKNTHNHTALEFAIRNPEGWIGVQVSHREGALFVTDPTRLLLLANFV